MQEINNTVAISKLELQVWIGIVYKWLTIQIFTQIIQAELPYCKEKKNGMTNC